MQLLEMELYVNLGDCLNSVLHQDCSNLRQNVIDRNIFV